MPDLTLPSRSASVREATEAAERLAEELGWSAPDVTRLALAVSESVANAVEHGPGGDIRVTVEPTPEGGIWTSVRDDGPGPRPDALLDASLPHDALSEGGRGLYIVRTVTDRVEVDGGVVRFLVCPQATA